MVKPRWSWHWTSFMWMDHMEFQVSNEIKDLKRKHWRGVPLWRFRPLIGSRVINDPTVDQLPKRILRMINR